MSSRLSLCLGLPPPSVSIVDGSLTHSSVTLTWDQLRDASYAISVVYVVDGEEFDEIISEQVKDTTYNITGKVISFKNCFTQILYLWSGKFV